MDVCSESVSGEAAVGLGRRLMRLCRRLIDGLREGLTDQMQFWLPGLWSPLEAGERFDCYQETFSPPLRCGLDRTYGRSEGGVDTARLDAGLAAGPDGFEYVDVRCMTSITRANRLLVLFSSANMDRSSARSTCHRYYLYMN